MCAYSVRLEDRLLIGNFFEVKIWSRRADGKAVVIVLILLLFTLPRHVLVLMTYQMSRQVMLSGVSYVENGTVGD